MTEQLALGEVGIRLVPLTNTDPEFYRRVGPFLCRREIVNATGQPFWDDEGKAWVVAVEDEHSLGCVAVRHRTRDDDVCSLWVRPSSRRRGLARRLVRATIAKRAGRPMQAIATPESLRVFLSCGFQVVGDRGRYNVMRLGLNQ